MCTGKGESFLEQRSGLRRNDVFILLLLEWSGLFERALTILVLIREELGGFVYIHLQVAGVEE